MTKPTDLDFAAAATSLVGVRYRTMGRSVVIGLDCYGILFVPAAMIGVHLPNVRDYDPRLPDPARLLIECRTHLIEQDPRDAGPGRIGLCGWEQGGDPRHFVVMLPGRQIVHVDATYRRVTRVPAAWMDSKLVATFRLQGVDYGASWQR